MPPTLTKKVNFLLSYQCALAIGAVLVFFTNVDWFFFTAEISPPPLVFLITFCLLSTPLLSSAFSRIKYLSIPVISWCAAYILIALISFSVSFPSEVIVQELSRRILAIIFILLMLLIFSKYYLVQLWTRRAIFITVLIAIFNIIYEFLNPLAFRPVSYSGRPAGFYVDPNKAGLALILGMIFNIDLFPPKYRVPLVLIIGISVFLTFSRGATLSWLVVVMSMLFTRRISGHQLFLWILGVVTGSVSVGLGALLNPDQLQSFGLVNKNILERLEWFQDPSMREDSADSRVEVVKIAWEMFAEHPFVGNGIGSTLNLDVGISTHNMYLLYMTDYGIIGVLIMPLLIYAVTWHARGEIKYIGLDFALLILLWCIFSHTVLDDRFIMLSISLVSAMNMTSQQEQKFQVRDKV